ncbi:MAG: tRNA (N(6)-L-threonylcarbamoyladenosine(37)-C(2))-methylthiotransferase MtaB [FCB group bacterium]|jgi:threonylcarbamoyladenosine tRNA methylthiotransferase MtaB|nr:tRNA (N(6)-L-threonylcarbamoyladenosine(37)-C(2))-methylthiotransferase MtaB [FCB group bacterium]
MAVSNQKRASLHTLGCRLNQSETAMIIERLQGAGYEIVPFGEPADLGIINTCTVTGEADAKSRQLLRSFIRKNPEAYTAVIGCYSQIGHKVLSEIEGVDLIVGTPEKLNVLDSVAEGKNEKPLVVRDRIDRDDFSIEVTGAAGKTRRANLKIQDGCDFMCSFCVIPFARGRARSRDLDNLLEEACMLAAKGTKEIVITGVNVGTYQHKGADIVDVVNRLNEIPGIERIRISSIEPTTIPDALLRVMNEPKHALVPYLHVPLQSGSDHVLGLMKRKYSRLEYLNFVRHAENEVNDICIGTDILVGTPGETEEDFEETCMLLEDSPLGYAHVFKYSERPGTAAQRIPDHVSAADKNRRSARIRRLAARKRTAFHERYIGRTVEVLFEHEEGGHWTGYTGNYIRVAARSTNRLENEIRTVHLEGCRGDIVLGTLQDE